MTVTKKITVFSEMTACGLVLCTKISHKNSSTLLQAADSYDMSVHVSQSMCHKSQGSCYLLYDKVWT